MSRKKRYYAPEFKREAVRLVLEEGRGIREVEKALDITEGLLKDWVKLQRIRDREVLSTQGLVPATVDAATRLKQLEKELERVRMERDILKKAVAIFSTDPNRYSGS